MYLEFIGVGVSLAGTFASGLGDNLVRYSYSMYEKVGVSDSESEESSPPVYKRPLWVSGWCLTIIVDTSCNGLALALAPMSVVMPLGAMHILWGVVFAYLINGEKVGRWDCAGAFFILLGVFFTLYFAPNTDDGTLSYDEILAVMKHAPFISGQLTALALTASCYLLKTYCPYQQVAAVASAAMPGVIGASSNLMLKLTEALGEKTMERWEFYVLACVVVFLAVSQLMSLNNALKIGEACTVIAIANSCMLVGGSIHGLINFAYPTTTQLVMLIVGIIVVLFGILLLSLRNQGVLEESDEENGIAEDDVADSGGETSSLRSPTYPKTGHTVQRCSVPNYSTLDTSTSVHEPQQRAT